MSGHVILIILVSNNYPGVEYNYNFGIWQYHNFFSTFQLNMWLERYILIVKHCWHGQYFSPPVSHYIHMCFMAWLEFIYWFGFTVPLFIHYISLLHLLG